MNTGHYRLMADYNRWMNQRLYACCARLDAQALRSDRGAFFKSAQATLDHLLHGDRAWMARFTGRQWPLAPLGELLYADFAELRREREQMDDVICDWAGALDPAWLATDFRYRSNVDGKTRTVPTWVLVSHFFNHQTHHRGQLTTLLSQLGLDYGATDIPWMPGVARIEDAA